MEVSAKKCINVDKCFKNVAEKVLEKIDRGELNPYDEVFFFFLNNKKRLVG